MQVLCKLLTVMEKEVSFKKKYYLQIDSIENKYSLKLNEGSMLPDYVEKRNNVYGNNNYGYQEFNSNQYNIGKRRK